jgi:hypothetical protein
MSCTKTHHPKFQSIDLSIYYTQVAGTFNHIIAKYENIIVVSLFIRGENRVDSVDNHIFVVVIFIIKINPNS